MGRLKRIALGAAAGAVVLLGAGWLGLQVRPAPFAPVAGPVVPAETIAMPTGLPAPLARYLRATFGDRVPLVHSATISGRGHLRFIGITFPARLRFDHRAGQSYQHAIDATWFGLPLLRVHESYHEGRARLELPVGIVENEPKVDQGANLALWGEELFWMPSVLVTDQRVHWEGIDAASARLIVPFGAEEEQFTVRFDAATGLLRQAEALRYKNPTDSAKTPWRIDILGWQTFQGVKLPAHAAITWEDEASPWLVLEVEDVAANTTLMPTTLAAGRTGGPGLMSRIVPSAWLRNGWGEVGPKDQFPASKPQTLP